MKVKVAVIGVGRMGSIHARNLKLGLIKGATLACICDINDEALSSFIKKHGRTKTYEDYKLMLEKENIDAVIVSTQHYFHGDIVKYCIEKGKHVLCEKPMTVTAEEARSVLKEANKRPELVLAVMWNQRTNPIHQKAYKLVQSGKIGKLIRMNYIVTDWYRSQAYYNQGGWRACLWGEGGGTLINQCVHQLDLLQWIAGFPIGVEAKMFTKGRNITVENDVIALFEYPEDVFCSFSASTHELRGTNRLEISGEKGRIVIENRKMKVYTFKKCESEVNAETKSGYGFVSRKVKRYGYNLQFALRLIRDFGEQASLIRNFVNSINGKGELLSPLKDGLQAVEMVNAIYISAWEKRKIQIPVDGIYYEKILKERIAQEKKYLGVE
ncbi:MAG: Gfo/Idh/MocA family oxidoreductase [Clostridia bacterium]